MGRNHNKPLYENVTITDIGSEGKSLARIGDKVVFTTRAVPGDVVDLQVIRKRSRYEEAVVLRYHRLSKDREDPACSHFGLCGGCSWQNLPYPLQLEFKQRQVADQLKRIGKLTLPGIDPIMGSPSIFHYRNKLEFSFSNNRWLSQEEMMQQEILEKDALGFHVPGRYDKIFQVDKCWLQAEPSNEIRNFIYEYAIRNHLDFFDIREQRGFLRTMVIRNSSLKDVMVILSFFHEDQTAREALLGAVKVQFPGITSLMYLINSKGNDTITDQEILLFSGKPTITEEMEGIRYRIGPKSFFQTNGQQALELYRKVREFASLQGDETVYDLYCGTGTITNFLAGSCRKIIGIESVPEAIRDAVENSAFNNISNTQFVAGDIKEVLRRDFFVKHGFPRVIITDPPRSGMHGEVVESILEAAPEKVVYVSCNPATQARDLALMSGAYDIVRVQPVDMFPHTHHVENIVLMRRRIPQNSGPGTC